MEKIKILYKGKPELNSKQGAGDLVDGKGGPVSLSLSRSLAHSRFFLCLGPF